MSTKELSSLLSQLFDSFDIGRTGQLIVQNKQDGDPPYMDKKDAKKSLVVKMNKINKAEA